MTDVDFLMAEDKALRDLLTGMTVSDDKSASRPVGVWFGQPDPEIRQQSFPFLTIDMIDLAEATERAMSGRARPWYLDVNATGFDDWSVWYPIPVNLTYQVTSFSRHPRHDRQIIGQVIGNRLPLRFGSLVVPTGKQDSQGRALATVRRLDTLRVLKRDTTESSKRMFMNVWTVRVSSEVMQPFDVEKYHKVSQVDLTRENYDPHLYITPDQREIVSITIASQP